VTGTITWDDGQERPFNLEMLADLRLAYALTIHKSQGSQWRRVIVALPEGRMLDRSLVYTAITRAEREVRLITRKPNLQEAVKQPKAADRRQVALDRWLLELRQ
jgi:exodeoxyribonuclease V alpha subunit